jgi:hypothetical protein
MTKMSEVHVTLSPELWKQFRQCAAETRVPLKWLVAGLVCDTLKAPTRTMGSQRLPLAVTDTMTQ